METPQHPPPPSDILTCTCASAPGAKLQLPQLWRSCLAGSDCWLPSPGFWSGESARINSPTSSTVWLGLVIQASAAAINTQAEWKSACVEQRGRMRAAGRLGGIQGYGVDGCPPFVLQIRGNLLAIVAPCLLAIQRAERGDFSSAEPMTSSFCSKRSSPSPSAALLSSLSVLAVSPHCSGCGQARLAAVA